MDRRQQHDGVVATVVVDRYRGDARGVRDRPRLRRTASRFVGQARRLGFHLPSLGVESSGTEGGRQLSAGREQILDLVMRLRRQSVDRKILYWTGHGEVVNGSFHLACEDSYEEGEFDPHRAVAAEELVSWLAEDATDTLLVLDACFSGEAVEEVSEHVKEARKRARVPDADAGFAVVATAGSRQEAWEGHWVDCLEQVLSAPDLTVDDSARIFHREQEAVPFQHLMRAVRARARDHVPFWQEPRPLHTWFLSNPYWSPRARAALRPEDDRSWIGKELADEELPVFSDSGESWHLRDFAPRHRVVTDLVDWLRVHESGMFTVTGASGAGKSTLLTYVAHLTVAHFVAALPADRRPGTLPELRSVNAALHCRGRTLSELCEQLARSLEPLGLRRADITQGAPHGHVARIAELAQLKGSLTLMFDGLDEAAAGHSFDIARRLLNPLAAQPRVRVVVATRPNARRNLPGDAHAETLLEVLHSTNTVELDRLPEVEQDIARHVERLLSEESSPYRLPEQAHTRERVARHIAAASNGLFLVATLWARRLAKIPALADEKQLGRELRKGTSVLDALLADELESLDPLEPARMRDFMRALALAQGAGLPQPRTWLAVTNAVRAPGSREYAEKDLRHVLSTATGVTIARAGESGEDVYCLHHPSFGAHLLGGEQQVRERHRAVCRALTPAGGEEWRHADHYVKCHLAAHAALAGDDVLEGLVSDWHFLVAASPDILEPLVAARLAATRESALYLRVADHFRRHPAEESRWAMLRATALAMFSRDFLASVPKPSFLFWDDVWSSAERLPLQRSWPAPTGGALAVHWEAQGDGFIHVSGAGEVWTWTADGRHVRGRDTGPATWTAQPRQRGVTATGRGGSRVIATHDGQCVRIWHGSDRNPTEELYWGGTPAVIDSVVGQDGEVFLAVADGDRLWLWRWDGTTEYTRDGLHLHPLRVPVPVQCVCLLVSDDRVAAVTGGPGGVTVWEVPGPKTKTASLRPVRTLGEGVESIRAVSALGPQDGDGSTTIAYLDGHTLRVWRMDDLFRGEAHLLFSASSAGRAVALGRGPRGRLTAVREGATVRVWDGSGTERVPLPCQHHHQSVAFDPAGTGRLVVADDTRVRIWEPHDPEEEGGATGVGRVGGRAVDRHRLRVAGGGPDDMFLLARSQGAEVSLSLHSPAGSVVEGVRLSHPAEVSALTTARVGDRWLTAAVGRRHVLLRTFGPGLELLDTEEFDLPGAAEQPVSSVALRVTGSGGLCLLWPSGQSVVTWERPGPERAPWRKGRIFWMRAAGAVQQIEVVEVPGGPSWLSAWGGNAVRLWNLGEAEGKPEGVQAPRARAIATGVLRRAATPVPFVALAAGDTVKFAECDGGHPVWTVLPRQPGGPVDGLALAGPAQRPLLVGWSWKSGRLRLWDIRGEQALKPIASRGFDVTGVDSVFDGRGITLMVQGIAQSSLRCDQVFLPGQAGQHPSVVKVVGQRTERAVRRSGRNVL
ncbi:NACHT domain-containing protein [Streptomyces sp. NPDC006134]|uniref:NACHT domain-containing protein n=1 Tax=Streptomyces sp. NPDC006134 TaxID=3154467 RepID=UPI0033C0B7BD